jgi:hypothetical protein
MITSRKLEVSLRWDDNSVINTEWLNRFIHASNLLNQVNHIKIICRFATDCSKWKKTAFAGTIRYDWLKFEYNKRGALNQ